MPIQPNFSSSDKVQKRVRRVIPDAKMLSITSLLDLLTIILVFLMKNISFEAVKISTENGLRYPTTMTMDAIMEKADVTPVKVFTDRILLGSESLAFGDPKELLTNPEKRTAISQYLQMEANTIYSHAAKDVEACLVVQADVLIPCEYISEIVKIGTSVGYTRVYFATIADADWLKRESVASTQ